jgi:hypothetical protein
MTRRAWFVVALAVVAAVVVGGVGVWLATRSSDDTAAHVLRGRITQSDLLKYANDKDCPDSRGPGIGQVIVRNGNGDVVGAGDIRQRVTDTTPITSPYSQQGEVPDRQSCEWTFSLPVKNNDFYTVKVGDWGAFTETASKMDALHWRLDYNLDDR